MDVEYNRYWNLQKFFNRLGHKSVILCLWLIRINGGLPYRWRHAESVFDQKAEPWGVEAKGRKAPFLLIRRPVLVAWSSVNAIIVCATFIVYVVFFVLPKFELLKSTEATAVLLKNLVEFMVAIGLVCYLRVKEGLLARLVCVMYGFGKPFGVPRTMDRSWMQMASAVIVKASLLSAFVIVAQNYRSDDTLYSKVDVAFSFIIRIVMSMSVLPVLLLLHYITLMMAVWYNDVYCSFQRHALDLIPTKNIREMVVTEQEAVQLSEGQPPQLSPSMNKAKMVPSSFPQPSLESPIMHVTETSIHVVYKLQHLQRLLNNYYSIPVLLVMTRSITNLVFLFFLVVMNPKNRSFFISMEALQEVASIVLMCLASETVAKQKRKLKSIVCCLKVFCSNFLQEKLGRFLELMSNDPGFNVSDYFMLAKNCLIPILSFIATYLVILLQFYVSESGCRRKTALPDPDATNGTTFNLTEAADTSGSLE